MAEEVSLGFRLRKTDETRNYLLDEMKHNDLMSEKYKKTCKYLNYVEHLLILASTVTGCVSISAFFPLVCVPVGITSLCNHKYDGYQRELPSIIYKFLDKKTGLA